MVCGILYCVSPPSFCSNSLPISAADDCQQKETGITPWADIKSDFEVKYQRDVVRLSTRREAETSQRDLEEPGREVMVKGLPHPAVPSTLGCKSPIRAPKFNQHQIKLSGGEGIASVTPNVKGIVILDCIGMRSRKLC